METVETEVTETVRATLEIEVVVECPKCNSTFDLLKKTNLNRDGYVLKNTISDDAWEKDSDDRLDVECDCPYCRANFRIKGVNW